MFHTVSVRGVRLLERLSDAIRIECAGRELTIPLQFVFDEVEDLPLNRSCELEVLASWAVEHEVPHVD